MFLEKFSLHRGVKWPSTQNNVVSPCILRHPSASPARISKKKTRHASFSSVWEVGDVLSL